MNPQNDRGLLSTSYGDQVVMVGLCLYFYYSYYHNIFENLYRSPVVSHLIPLWTVPNLNLHSGADTKGGAQEAHANHFLCKII